MPSASLSLRLPSPTPAFPSSERVRSARQETGACSSAGQALGRAAKRRRSRDEHHIPGYRVADPFPHRTLSSVRLRRGFHPLSLPDYRPAPMKIGSANARKPRSHANQRRAGCATFFDVIVTALPRIVRSASDRLGSSAIIPGERRSVRRNASSGSRRARTRTAVGYSGAPRRTERTRPPRLVEERY